MRFMPGRKQLRWPLLLLMVVAAAIANAQREATLADLEAAYLYKFAGYVEWPQGSFSRADSPLVIGVVGADDLADTLEHIVSGQAVAGRPVIVRRIRQGQPLGGLHILFIGHAADGGPANLLAATHGQPVLTVTESEVDYAQGSMINLLRTDNRMRFEVSLAPVETSHLKISARMLTAAYSVLRSQP